MNDPKLFETEEPFFLEFAVPGVPQPVGSKRAVLIKMGDRFRAGLRDDNQNDSDRWRAMIERAARKVYRGEFFKAKFELSVEYCFQRPESHYLGNDRSRPLKKKWIKHGNAYTNKPDLDKLTRCVKDALTKVVWFDDSYVVGYREPYRKIWVDGQPGAIIRIYATGRMPMGPTKSKKKG